VLNPAIAIGTSFTQLFDQGSIGFKYVWLFGLFPFAGALVGVLFHEFFYKKSQEVLESAEDDEDNDTLLDK
jgi:glycerol uptake facilitator-like aquaporin